MPAMLTYPQIDPVAIQTQINNVNAVQGITYVADVPPLRAGR